MGPIRVGLIGLSSVTGDVSPSPGDGWAASAHLPYLKKSSHYVVTALCNSSVQSAQAAVKRYDLSPTTRTYGSPDDIAKDLDVDLVVCSVRVDRHYRAILPSINKGKDVFVEWPLASNIQQAEELLAAAKKSGSRTIVGLQGRSSPFTRKVKELVQSNAIGDLLSSNMTFTTGAPGDTELPGGEFFAKKEVGGNLFTIIFGHGADSVFYALGGGPKELSALLTTRWPLSKAINPDGSVNRIVKRETPDHVMMQGVLTNNNAPISISVRSGRNFKDTPPLTWRIFGSKGEIRVTSRNNLSTGVGGEKVELHNHEKDTVEVINAQWSDDVKDLPPFARNVGMLYESFANGSDVETGFVDFAEAVKMHSIIDAMENSNESRKSQEVVR